MYKEAPRKKTVQITDQWRTRCLWMMTRTAAATSTIMIITNSNPYCKQQLVYYRPAESCMRPCFRVRNWVAIVKYITKNVLYLYHIAFTVSQIVTPPPRKRATGQPPAISGHGCSEVTVDTIGHYNLRWPSIRFFSGTVHLLRCCGVCPGKFLTSNGTPFCPTFQK